MNAGYEDVWTTDKAGRQETINAFGSSLDLHLAGPLTITANFYTVGFETGPTTVDGYSVRVEQTFTLILADPRCVPDFQLPTIESPLVYEIGQGPLDIVDGASNGNCEFSLDYRVD